MNYSIDDREERSDLCGTYECDEPRKPFDELCVRCAAIRDDARATFQGAVMAGMIEGV